MPASSQRKKRIAINIMLITQGPSVINYMNNKSDNDGCCASTRIRPLINPWDPNRHIIYACLSACCTRNHLSSAYHHSCNCNEILSHSHHSLTLWYPNFQIETSVHPSDSFMNFNQANMQEENPGLSFSYCLYTTITAAICISLLLALHSETPPLLLDIIIVK